MKGTIGIITPVVDGGELRAAEKEFLLVTRAKNRKLTLKSFYELGENTFNADKLEDVKTLHGSTITSAGYHLTGVLRLNGYNTVLTNQWDDDSLRGIARQTPIAVCISTTMIFTREALKNVINRIRAFMPDVLIVAGGIFLWKSFVAMNDLKNIDVSKFMDQDSLSNYTVFPCTKDELDADVMIVSPHGIASLLEVMETIGKGGAGDLESIPNLAIPDRDGRFVFTRRVDEEVDYNNEFTRWDMVDELPSRIPLRTSVGCPYRCGFCDFYNLYPKIFMRSPESLLSELRLLKERLGSNKQGSVLYVTDDNVFITPRRVEEFCNTLLQSDLGIGWTGFLRSSSVNAENIDIISSTNLVAAVIGVESGDDGQLARMRKMQTSRQQREGIQLLDRAGISSIMSFVVGYPGETEETVANTANFLNSLNTNLANYYMLSLVVMPFSAISKPELREEYKLKGLWTTWEHYTTNSDEVSRHCYSLFKQTKNVPYTYTEEDMLFNQTRLNNEQRRVLYRLRKKLTEQYIENREWNELQKTYRNIYQTLGFGDIALPESLKNDIYCPVTLC